MQEGIGLGASECVVGENKNGEQEMNSIIHALVKGKKPYLSIDSFSDKPGIYALFFNGNSFPLPQNSPAKEDIIYIGKTESSQASRDRDTHFASGKTGSSTLRKSFGAMLRAQLNLSPVPRGQSDIEKNRINHFKFDPPSEEKLTVWMQNNLSLAFYEFTGTMEELDHLETNLIRETKPLLNIDWKNPDNPYNSIIKGLRKETGLIAYDNLASAPSQKIKTELYKQKKLNVSKINISRVHKYEDIWRQLLPDIEEVLRTYAATEIHIGRAPFEAVGNRKSYSFRLEIQNGIVANNIDGSAVARDLARVVLNYPLFVQASKGKQLIFKLDKRYTLHIAVQ